MNKNAVKLLAFDADDTLWDCQSFFEHVEEEYCKLLSDYGSTKEISDALFRTETANMPLLGYGSKAFTISLVENAVRVSGGRVKGDTISQIVMLGKSLLELPATPLPGVRDTLAALRQSEAFKMVVFTKGEILDQENKLRRSGLERYFDGCVVVADKTVREYQGLCERYGIDISELLMVGNSFKSDIEPVLRLGGYAVHVPFHTMWKHEQTKEYAHNHLITIENFAELKNLLL